MLAVGQNEANILGFKLCATHRMVIDGIFQYTVGKMAGERVSANGLSYDEICRW